VANTSAETRQVRASRVKKLGSKDQVLPEPTSILPPGHPLELVFSRQNLAVIAARPFAPLGPFD